MKTIIAAFIILYSGITYSAEGDLWLDINVASYHTSSEYCYEGKCKDYNQFNYGGGVSYDLDNTFELTGGYFRNSYYKNSFYAGTKIKHDFPVNGLIITPGVIVGGITGYDDTEVNGKKIQPIGLPTLGISNNKFRAVIGYLPVKIIGAGSADVFTLQLGVKF